MCAVAPSEQIQITKSRSCVCWRTEAVNERAHDVAMHIAAALNPEPVLKTGMHHLFRVFHDKERAQGNELDDAQIAHEYAQFSLDLAGYYERWPAIEASCLPSSESGLLVRLVSELPSDAVHNSLADLLVFLNQRVVDHRIGQPCFVMQQQGGKTKPQEWPKG